MPDGHSQLYSFIGVALGVMIGRVVVRVSVFGSIAWISLHRFCATFWVKLTPFAREYVNIESNRIITTKWNNSGVNINKKKNKKTEKFRFAEANENKLTCQRTPKLILQSGLRFCSNIRKWFTFYFTAYKNIRQKRKRLSSTTLTLKSEQNVLSRKKAKKKIRQSFFFISVVKFFYFRVFFLHIFFESEIKQN